MIRCARCNRILARSAAKVETAAGVAHYGPACAVRAGLLPEPARRITRPRRVARASAQMALEGVAA